MKSCKDCEHCGEEVQLGCIWCAKYLAPTAPTFAEECNDYAPKKPKVNPSVRLECEACGNQMVIIGVQG